jgi:hypothetical protein
MLTIFVFDGVITGSRAAETYFTTPSSSPDVIIQAFVVLAAFINPFRKILASLGWRLKLVVIKALARPDSSIGREEGNVEF